MNNKSLHSSLTPNFSNFGISSNSCGKSHNILVNGIQVYYINIYYVDR